MRDLLKRIERAESGLTNRYPWNSVCSECKAQGCRHTPYQHCEAKRCEAGHLAWMNQIEAHPDLLGRMMEAWDKSCEMAGKDPAAENQKIMDEDRAKREAWAAKIAEAEA